MKKLDSYMQRNNLTLGKFAKKIGVSTTAVHRWVKGKSLPSTKLAIVIEKKTKGEVSVYDWK